MEQFGQNQLGGELQPKLELSNMRILPTVLLCMR